jgi:hypothetical protein
MGHDRHNAVALKAADAKTLLNSTLPFVLKHMTAQQLDQVQKVLDAEVVNPEIIKKFNDMYRQSVIAQSGDLVMRDQKIVDRAYKIAGTQIRVSEGDKHVRLDYKVLLTPDAFLPVTDNPDEKQYLIKVRQTLENRGVWLRFDHQLVRVPGDYGHWMVDPRSFIAWLSLGYGGETIPTKDGQIDREALLGTTMIGAGYWENVHHGPIQQALERQMNALSSDIQEGMAEHSRLIMRKAEAPIVGGISDTVGGAHLPDISIWKAANDLLVRAMYLNVHGNVGPAQPYLVIAAIMARNNANLLAEYAEASSSGAESVVKVLKVARTAGKVAEIGLAVTGVVGIARAGAGVVAGEAAAADASVDAAAEKLVQQYVKRNPEIAADLNKVKWVRGPKGTTLGRGFKAGQSTGNGTGWDKW